MRCSPFRFPIRLFLTLCFLLLTSLSLQAGAGLFDTNPFGKSNEGPLQVDDAYHFDFERVAPDRVKLLWTIQPDYYLYRDRMEFKSLDGTSKVIGRINAPSEEKDDPLFGKVQVYHEFAEVELQLASVGTTAGDDRLAVTYQGCWEGGICYPPVTREISLAGIPVADALVGESIAEAGSAGGEPAPLPGLAEGGVSYSGGALPVSEQDRFVGLLRDAGLGMTLGAFFLAGMALAFTPCVFPMIPIISSIIAGHGHRISTGRALGLSLVYVLAVSVSYTLVGIFAGLFGANLQAAFQHPWIVGAFSGLFVLLALSMFGFYELQLPASWQSRLSRASNRRQGGTLGGVAVMGLLSALIVGPCMAAPLAGALIYIGQTGDPVLGGSALFALSLGMGVPLLLVGASAGKLLPKAGLWMEAVKAAFGVALLLMAIWMLDRIIPDRATMALTALVLIVSAVYMNALDRLPDQSSGWHRLWKGVGLILLVYGLALMVGIFSGSRSLVYPLQGLAGSSTASASLPFSRVTSMDQLQPMLERARQDGRPVMLDFFAEWCVSCYELEYVTFDDERVRQALSRYELIKVDVTANDAAARRLHKEYSVIGPPALLFYDSRGVLKPQLTLIGVVDPDDFLTHLGRVEG